LGEPRAKIDYILLLFKLRFPGFFLSVLDCNTLLNLRKLLRFIAVENQFHRDIRGEMLCTVLSDKCEPVSVIQRFQSVKLRSGHTTRPERQHGSA
jgi:hypothetical protein